MQFQEMNEHTLEELKKAIQQALEEGQLFDSEQAEQMAQQLQKLSPEQLDQLLDRLVRETRR